MFGANVPNGCAEKAISVAVSPLVVARKWLAKLKYLTALSVAVLTCNFCNYLHRRQKIILVFA
jgi:hypothetical protein